MGAFNTLITETICTNCQKQFQVRLQFKFGDTWQHIYHMGNALKWNGNDIGSPDLHKVRIYGIAENSICAYCGYENSEEFDIDVENNILIKIHPLADIENYDQHTTFFINN
jgi:hypothetical protein